MADPKKNKKDKIDSKSPKANPSPSANKDLSDTDLESVVGGLTTSVDPVAIDEYASTNFYVP
jgi:hypothetical protein